MMKIIRSEGQSYTVIDEQADRKMMRGLRRKTNKLLPHGVCGDSLEIHPPQLGDFLGSEYRLVVRQVISALDKVITKPRRLANCDIQTYVDRTRLAVALWKRLDATYGQDLRELDDGGANYEEFRKFFFSKVHPYAERDCNFGNADVDENAKIIRKLDRNKTSREAAAGRWSAALWKSEGGKPNYEATAAAIWSHLFEHEVTVAKGDVRKRDPLSPVRAGGLISVRAQSIAHSAGHPLFRNTVAADTPDNTPENRRRAKRAALAAENIHEIYFERDIAAEIVTSTINVIEADLDSRRPPVQAQHFGAILYDHFGRIMARPDFQQYKLELWPLHNQVREFYRDLARSDRFKLATFGATRDLIKIKQLLPANRDALVRVLSGKSQNRDISELVRLGKLIAHATEMPTTIKDPQAEFERRLRELATSAGQNEIKRNESFTRVWRTAVALSLRSLEVLAPVDPNRKDKKDEKWSGDPSTTDYAKHVATHDGALTRFASGLALTFGAKKFEDKSRSESLLTPEGSDASLSAEKRSAEIAWGLLRIAAEIRNATSHFNTKRRLLELLTSEILVWQEMPTDFHNRKANVGHVIARDAFNRLLAFDLKLRRRVVLDEFLRLKVQEYVSKDNLDELFVELRQSPDMIGITMPKFMSVMQNAVNIGKVDGVKVPEWLKALKSLDLSDMSKQPDTANRFKIGVLRQLYETGFASWLAQKQGNAEFLREALSEVTAFKKQRFTSYQSEASQKGRGRYYAEPTLIAETLPIDESTTLDSLIKELHAQAMRDEALRHTYKADRTLQSERTSQVNAFKLDLFAYFLGTYLQETRFLKTDQNGKQANWLMDISRKLPDDQQADKVDFDKYAGDDTPLGGKGWHSHFYTWLYLVPMDELALLRHQFRKTRALEDKAEDKTWDRMLGEIDQLMGLCLRVSSAGFSGVEHAPVLNSMVSEDKDRKLLIDDLRRHEAALPGTNRGLRQLLQLGTHGPLTRIFAKHPVTKQELALLEELQKKQNLKEQEQAGSQVEKLDDLFSERNTLAKKIRAMAKERAPDLDKLRPLCINYQEKAAQAVIYNFSITGARLRDHVRLHQLLMRVLARLLDFTLMWERDKQYVYMGMLYRQMLDEINASQSGRVQEGPVFAASVAWNDPDRPSQLGFHLPEKLGRKLVEDKPSSDAAKPAFLPIWDQRMGYVLDGDERELRLLPEAERRLFSDAFVKIVVENPLDQEARAARKAKGLKSHPPEAHGKRPSHYTGKAQIRHDFAHFNMLRGERISNGDLSYLVNSVRSLVSYDRKLKNAVTTTIADILTDEGLTIRWKMREDRLKEAEVLPDLVRHLGYIRIKDFNPQFVTPKVSVRFTSMVMALFNFGSGGYRDIVGAGKDASASGELRYPTGSWEPALKAQLAVPEAFVDLRFDKLASAES